jgi:ABC-type nitrate/sulfonate/bicarbonate transport system substrate-binding protein
MLAGLVAVCAASCARQPLRIGYTPWPANEPLTFAESVGKLPENIRLCRLSSTNDLLLAFGAGQLELVVLSATSTLRISANHLPVVALAALNVSAGADGVLAAPGVDRASLAGHTALTANHDDNLYLLFRMLGNRDPAVFLRLTKLPTDTQVSEAFSRSDGELACLSDPMLLDLEDVKGRALVSSRDFPDELASLLVTSRDTATARAPEIKRLLDFWFSWVAQVGRSPEYIQAVARQEKITLATARRVVDRIAFPTATRSLAMLRGESPSWYGPTVSYLATCGVTGVAPVGAVVFPELLASVVGGTP